MTARAEPGCDDLTAAEVAFERTATVTSSVTPSKPTRNGTAPNTNPTQVRKPPVAPKLPPTAEEVLRSDAFSKPRRYYPTGFGELDRLLAGTYHGAGTGLPARCLAVIAGPTGVGKTGWALGLSIQLVRGLRQTGPVLYVSTELEPAEVAARVAAQAYEARHRADVERRIAASADGVADGPDLATATPGQILGLEVMPTEAADLVAGWPIYIYEHDPWDPAREASNPIEAIRAQAEAIKAATGVMPVIVVDYLQHLASEDPEQRRLSVSSVANRLRRLARDLDVPVVALSSVGRASYKRKGEEGEEEDARDWIAAAKESGDIEYACATFGYLEPGKMDVDGESPARLIIAKARGGRHGFVGLRFHGPSGLWWSSADSLDELGVSGRMNELDDRVLSIIATHPGEPWTKIRDLAKCAPKVAAAARDRLMDAKRVEEDHDSPRRTSQIKMYRVVGSAAQKPLEGLE